MQEIIKGLLHTFYIFSHPFDGFWTMKSEKKGNLKSGIVILILLVVTTAYRILSSGYLFTSKNLSQFSIWVLALLIIACVLLYCVANWALTTLFDGKGKISEIFIALMYSVAPIVIVNLPITLLTHVVVSNEAAFVSFISIISIIWSVFLLLIGNLTIHEYTMFKSIISVAFTLVAMLAIVVLLILGCNMIQQVWIWLTSIIKEIALRL